MAIFWVALGGASGALFRFLLQSSLNYRWYQYPMGTLLANSLGCFVVGLIFPYIPDLHPTFKLTFLTGFLGSLTTLSSLHLEVFDAWERSKMWHAVGHWFGGAVFGFLVFLVGLLLSQHLGKSPS